MAGCRDHLLDGAKGRAVEGCARRGSTGLCLAASEYIEGHPEEEVGQHIKVDLGAPLSVLEYAASVLRPALQLLPARKKTMYCCCEHMVAEHTSGLGHRSLHLPAPFRCKQ